MKNICLSAIALFTLLFTSCKKDYTCTCTEKISGVPTIVGTQTIRDISKNAASQCRQYAATNFSSSGAYVSCKVN